METGLASLLPEEHEPDPAYRQAVLPGRDCLARGRGNSEGEFPRDLLRTPCGLSLFGIRIDLKWEAEFDWWSTASLLNS
jgi:hypothetical protein